ncbi:hypothetical protein [Roseomonas sp. BN140053]|uniref:hypothetical protein n=1 Tax=Roseomonas sp. BN140053 TaxID=3391898 RepID=UPI0039E902E4
MQPSDAAKLARVLGLLGSEHVGERAAAAAAAHRLAKRLGLSWQEVLMPRRENGAPPDPRRPAPPDMLEAAQSRLRQSQRENDDLRRQISRLKRRLEAMHQPSPPRWPD